MNQSIKSCIRDFIRSVLELTSNFDISYIAGLRLLT